MVNALMPTGHWATGKLWRTSAVVDATTDNDCVKAATAYLDSIAGNAFASDPEVAEIAVDSGNPALAAALGKLGARK